MIEVVEPYMYEVALVGVGMAIGYGCPKCAEVFMKKIVGDRKCEDCPDGDCSYCPETDGGNN